MATSETMRSGEPEAKRSNRGTKVDIHCLSLAPDLPCYLVCVRDLRLVIDCPLDLSVLRHFMPNHPLSLPGAASQPREKLDPRKSCAECQEVVICGGEAFLEGQPEVGFHSTEELKAMLWDSVDAILISNSRTILGLPFITERTKFRGKVLATEPTVQFGRQLMEGLTGYVAELPKTQRCTAFRDKLSTLPYPLNSAADVSSWCTLYTQKEVARCLERIERVSFSQNIQLYGNQVEIIPLRSGHMIGSCNWLIVTSNGERIAYIGASTVGNSHSLPMDRLTPRLKAADLLVMSSLSRVPHLSPRNSVTSLLDHTVETLTGGGNVLFPVHSSGLVFDLIEAVYERLQETDNLNRIPMYFISAQSKSGLAYANIFSEWLTESKQRSVLEANPPFVHESLIRDNKLKALPTIHGEFARSYKQPCVVFCDHPSIRFGPMVHLLYSWREVPNHSLIITEPDSAEMRLMLSPFQPLHQMRVFHCPVDNRLTFHEANALLYELAPRRVLAPCEYLDSKLQDGRAGPTGGVEDSSLTGFGHTLVPSRNEMELTGCSRRQVHTFVLEPPSSGVEPGGGLVEIDAALAADVQPISAEQGSGSVVLLNACLVSRNGKRRMVMPSTKSGGRSDVAARCLVGRVDTTRLMEELLSRGFDDAKLEKMGDDDHIVYFLRSGEDILIRLSAHATHIICSDERTRERVRDSLVACLTQL